MIFIMFLILATIIILAGKKLSIYGDIIGDKKGWEKSWVGIVMLASVTSLPELITSASASISGHPEMAISNVFGSNIFNMFIVFVLDIFILKKISFSSKVNNKNILTGLLSILITIIFLLGTFLEGIEVFGFLSIVSIIILIVYFISMKMIYVYEKDVLDEIAKETEEIITYISYKKAKLGFALSAGLVIITGIFLVYVSEIIARTPIFGIVLGESFVGVILLALATSLPELTVSIQAVKLKSYDMAAGNILGSNLFNLGIIFIADLFSLQRGVFKGLKDFHLVSAVLSILMIVIFLMGILFKNKTRKYDGVIIGLIYIVGMYILYQMR